MNSVKNNKLVYLILIIFCVFLSFAHSLLQVSVDSGLVLSNIINYPDPISPMKYYYLNSWTVINQFSEVLLRIGLSVENTSRIILFLSSLCFAISAFLMVNKITSKKLLALFISLLMLVFQKNFGDTDYPSLVISSHTYGMFSLAISSLIFALLISEFSKLAGFFSTLLICIHPVIGIWILFVFAISLILFREEKIRNNFIKGSVYGIAITFISLITFYIRNIGTIDFDIQNLNSYIENWDGHRNKLGTIHFEYLLKTLFLFLTVNIYYFLRDNEKKSDFFKIFFNTNIILSTLIYLLFKLIPEIFPDIIFRAMPSRLIILHSFIAWPLILSVFYFIFSKIKITKKLSTTIISIILILYSIQHYKNFVYLKNNYVFNVINRYKNPDFKFFNDLINLKTSGYFITTSSTTSYTHLLGLKPILLDTSSFDFIPYHPYLVNSVYQILQDVYGVQINSPPIKNNPSIPDAYIKSIFENKLRTEWLFLKEKYNATHLLVPSNWKIDLDLIKKNKSFAVYKIK